VNPHAQRLDAKLCQLGLPQPNSPYVGCALYKNSPIRRYRDLFQRCRNCEVSRYRIDRLNPRAVSAAKIRRTVAR
jgi:hypothetical protein